VIEGPVVVNDPDPVHLRYRYVVPPSTYVPVLGEPVVEYENGIPAGPGFAVIVPESHSETFVPENSRRTVNIRL
jgi:hypothetical protein